MTAEKRSGKTGFQQGKHSIMISIFLNTGMPSPILEFELELIKNMKSQEI